MNKRFWRHADYLHIKIPSFNGDGMREIVIKRGAMRELRERKGVRGFIIKGMRVFKQ